MPLCSISPRTRSDPDQMSATEHTADDTHTNGHGNGHNGHDGHHGPPPPRTGWRRWTGPGWLRVLWVTPLVGFIGLGIVCAIRWAADWLPVWYAPPLVTVATITFPLGFLGGLGAFD